jgi:hypothetical protein
MGLQKDNGNLISKIPYSKATYFASAVRGGLDITLNNRISLQAIQFDYVLLGGQGFWGDGYGRGCPYQ